MARSGHASDLQHNASALTRNGEIMQKISELDEDREKRERMADTSQASLDETTPVITGVAIFATPVFKWSNPDPFRNPIRDVFVSTGS